MRKSGGVVHYILKLYTACGMTKRLPPPYTCAVYGQAMNKSYVCVKKSACVERWKSSSVRIDYTFCMFGRGVTSDETLVNGMVHWGLRTDSNHKEEWRLLRR